MVTIPCLFCHTDNSPIAIKENGYQGKQCMTCNVIYVSPRPTLEQIANLYGHDQAHISAHSHIAQAYPKKLHAKHTLSIIKKYVSGGDLLEIGAGAGYFLTQAQLQGFAPYGIELNPTQAKFIQESLKIPCLESPLDAYAFNSKIFDIVYHSDVLSHFYDPIQALHTIWNKLKPGGYMIFETGNIADIHPRYYSAFPAMQYPDHLFFFGKKSITQLLDITGFAIKEYYSYSILPQLRIMKVIQKCKAALMQAKSTIPSTFPPITTHSFQTRNTSIARSCYHYLLHMMRYRIGAYIPHKEKPQTVIVVAQKRE